MSRAKERVGAMGQGMAKEEEMEDPEDISLEDLLKAVSTIKTTKVPTSPTSITTVKISCSTCGALYERRIDNSKLFFKKYLYYGTFYCPQCPEITIEEWLTKRIGEETSN